MLGHGQPLFFLPVPSFSHANAKALSLCAIAVASRPICTPFFALCRRAPQIARFNLLPAQFKDGRVLVFYLYVHAEHTSFVLYCIDFNFSRSLRNPNPPPFEVCFVECMLITSGRLFAVVFIAERERKRKTHNIHFFGKVFLADYERKREGA